MLWHVTKHHQFTGMTVTVRKEWKNADLVTLPDSVDITLSRKAGQSGTEETVKQGKLTKQDGWTAAFSVPKQGPGEAAYTYSVHEDTAGNWTTEYADPVTVESGVLLTMANSINLVDIPVKKIWDDQNGQYKNRPKSVTLYLYSNPGFGAKRMGSVTLSDANGWEGSFQQVPLYPDAKPGSPTEVFNFNVREPYIPGYVTAVRNVAAETDPVPSFEVTNTLKYRNITISKIWEDNDDALKFRPDSVIIEVMEEGNVQEEVTLDKNTDPAWTSTVALPDLINGQTATYEVREKTGIEPHRTTVTGTDETGFEVINTLLPQTTDIQVFKEWLDVTEDHPEITLRLLSDEKQARKFEEAGSCTLDGSPGTGWTHVFSGMPVYTDKGRVIIYDLTEDELPGYGAPVVFDQDYSFIIFNWKIPERAKVIVLKTWLDQPGDSYTVTGDHTFVAQWEKITPEPPYDFRFVFTKKWSGSTEDSINWTLYNPDGSIRHKKFNKKVISDTEWRYEAWFETAADYYIIEEVPEGYHVRYENVGAHAGETDRCYNGGTIINYRIPKTGDNAPLLLWSAGVLLGTAGMLGLVFRRRLRRKKK